MVPLVKNANVISENYYLCLDVHPQKQLKDCQTSGSDPSWGLVSNLTTTCQRIPIQSIL